MKTYTSKKYMHIFIYMCVSPKTELLNDIDLQCMEWIYNYTGCAGTVYCLPTFEMDVSRTKLTKGLLNDGKYPTTQAFKYYIIYYVIYYIHYLKKYQ